MKRRASVHDLTSKSIHSCKSHESIDECKYFQQFSVCIASKISACQLHLAYGRKALHQMLLALLYYGRTLLQFRRNANTHRARAGWKVCRRDYHKNTFKVNKALSLFQAQVYLLLYVFVSPPAGFLLLDARSPLADAHAHTREPVSFEK